MIEVHPCPERALSDGAQSLDIPQFARVMDSLGDPLRECWLSVSGGRRLSARSLARCGGWNQASRPAAGR